MSKPAEKLEWNTVGDIPGFPFKSFRDLQAAVAEHKVGLGVDSLAAARWSDRYASGPSKAVVGALSILILVAALAAVITSLVLRDYWLLTAAPIMGIVFYISHPSSPISKWVTIGGALSVAVFIDLLLNGFLTSAVLAAYAGLTFAAVRAAGFVAISRYRRALVQSEAEFVRAYRDGTCNIKDNKSERIYISRKIE
jgi:hypothetical protein